MSGAIDASISVKLGVDPTPSAILNGVPTFDAECKRVLVPVQGGVDGNDYAIKVVCQTSNPTKRLALVAVLPIRKAV